MEINFTISREELLNFHIKYATKTKFYKDFINFFYSYSFLIFITALIISKDIINALSLFVPIILIMFLIKKMFFLYYFKKVFSKKYLLEKYKSYFCSAKLSINKEYLNLITDLDEKHYKWKSIQNVYLIDKYIFITTKSHDDILIPITAFESQEYKNLFLDTIIKNTNLELKDTYPSIIFTNKAVIDIRAITINAISSRRLFITLSKNDWNPKIIIEPIDAKDIKALAISFPAFETKAIIELNANVALFWTSVTSESVVD